jgi:hypothetical protein
MDNWLANIVDDVDSLHVEIDNLNNPLVGFCFIKNIDSKQLHRLATAYSTRRFTHATLVTSHVSQHQQSLAPSLAEKYIK